MNIYFTCSTAELIKFHSQYFKIREILIKSGNSLTRDWLPHTYSKILKGETDLKRDIREIYKQCLVAIKEADVVVIEDTVSNFSTGHQITLALQMRKPTLVLWEGQKHKQFNQMFIHGIESDILQVSEYNQYNLEEIIELFVAKYEDTTERNRFHLVLNKTERMYLDWAQITKSKSRTKIIRDGLKQLIEKDIAYSDYLRKRQHSPKSLDP